MKDEIIDLVYNTPAVWDKQHKHHHNRHVLAKEWKKIAAKMGAAEMDVRRCWKNLRQEFGKQLRKSDFQSGEASTDDIQWPFFQKLLFLQDQFPSRVGGKPDSNESSYPDDRSASKQSDDVSDLESDIYTDEEEDIMPSEFLLQTTSITPPPILDHSGSRSNPPCLSPRPQRLAVMPKQQQQQPPDISNPGKKRKLDSGGYDQPMIDHRNDEDVGFFNSLLPHVRRLSPRDKFIFRMRVQQTLFELAFPETGRTPGQANGGPEMYPSAFHEQEHYDY